MVSHFQVHFQGHFQGLSRGPTEMARRGRESAWAGSEITPGGHYEDDFQEADAEHECGLLRDGLHCKAAMHERTRATTCGRQIRASGCQTARPASSTADGTVLEWVR